MTMISILAASVVGSWTYAGFLAQPKPKPAPPAASAPIVPAGETGTKPAESSPDSTIPNPAAATKPPASPPPISPKPKRYRLTDASGQTWEHTDPAYLSSFVEALNNARLADQSRP
jgi:hypothetical protein